MPTLQHEQQICEWLEKTSEEVSSTSYRDSSMGDLVRTPRKSVKGVPHTEARLRFHFAFHCLRSEINPEQDIWDLAHTARVKVARDAVEEYESKKLIEEINEAYDEEMEQEDKEFARRTKGYYRRLLSTED